jgi:hypothetical protein
MGNMRSLRELPEDKSINILLVTKQDGDMLGSVNHRTRIVRDEPECRNAGDSLRSGVRLPEPIGLKLASANPGILV